MYFITKSYSKNNRNHTTKLSLNILIKKILMLLLILGFYYIYFFMIKLNRVICYVVSILGFLIWF
jgi:hypothetical protein